jgi:hypothetical protein
MGRMQFVVPRGHLLAILLKAVAAILRLAPGYSELRSSSDGARQPFLVASLPRATCERKERQ